MEYKQYIIRFEPWNKEEFERAYEIIKKKPHSYSGFDDERIRLRAIEKWYICIDLSNDLWCSKTLTAEQYIKNEGCEELFLDEYSSANKDYSRRQVIWVNGWSRQSKLDVIYDLKIKGYVKVDHLSCDISECKSILVMHSRKWGKQIWFSKNLTIAIMDLWVESTTREYLRFMKEETNQVISIDFAELPVEERNNFNNTKPTNKMNKYIEVQTEEFFKKKANITAIEKALKNVASAEDTFQQVGDIASKCKSRLNRLRRNLRDAIDQNDIGRIRQHIEEINETIDYTNDLGEHNIFALAKKFAKPDTETTTVEERIGL